MATYAHSIEDSQVFLSEFDIDVHAKAVGNHKVQSRKNEQEESNGDEYGIQEGDHEEREEEVYSMEEI